MASKKQYPKVTKTISLDLSEVPRGSRTKVKKDIGEFIVNEILLSVSDEKSPVEGGKYTKGLSEEYRKVKGSNKANLELEGDLLDSLTFELNDKGLEIGIFDKSQTGKADGHNQIHDKHKTLPERRFIPDEKQTFKKNIMNGVKQIINDNKKAARRDRQSAQDDFTMGLDQEIGFDLKDIIGQDLIDELF
jgi:hypothetical protein